MYYGVDKTLLNLRHNNYLVSVYSNVRIRKSKSKNVLNAV